MSRVVENIESVKVVRYDGSFEAGAMIEHPFAVLSGETLEVEVPSNYPKAEMISLAERRAKELQRELFGGRSPDSAA